jgi:hypothetical protein
MEWVASLLTVSNSLLLLAMLLLLLLWWQLNMPLQHVD